MKTYLENLIPMIISGDFSKMTKQEKEILSEIRNNLSKNEWKILGHFFWVQLIQLKKKLKMQKLENLLKIIY